jgi:hypothetical protein
MRWFCEGTVTITGMVEAEAETEEEALEVLKDHLTNRTFTGLIYGETEKPIFTNLSAGPVE